MRLINQMRMHVLKHAMVQVPEDEVAQRRARAPFEGLRFQVLAAAFRLHARGGPASLRELHYHWPDYERLVMWKARYQSDLQQVKFHFHSLSWDLCADASDQAGVVGAPTA